MIRKFVALSVLLFCAVFASADSYNFTYSGNNGDIASGTLITTAEGGGQFLITNITNGIVDGVAIAALLPPGSIGGNDNLLFVPPSPGYLDFNGFSFADVNANQFNIYYTNGTYDLISTIGAFDTSGTFTITPVGPPPPIPEPGSMLLLGTGLLGAAGALRRKYIV